MEAAPKTLQEAMVYFADAENCRQFMVKLRWPDGKVRCPYCNSENVDYLPNAKVYKCYEKHPKQKFSLKIGTVFEDSPIPLEKWLPVMWLIVNAKNGISSWEIHRAMGVTQKTAWFMLQRARLAMQDNKKGGKLSGEVEIDETFIGGKARNMHKAKRIAKLEGKGGGSVGKIGVQGLLERGGEIRAHVINDSTIQTLVPNVQENVAEGSHVYTDQLPSYFGLQADYAHDVINHTEMYVNGQIHLNGLENFWSLLKRGLGGTYVSVEPFHLFRYVDEQVFRYNHRRDANDGERFVAAMKQIVGRRLTYKELTGKEAETASEEAF
ncbi:MAG TPA: IS1595 family transposase [Bryobacteraceae bacterium]|jgi:transposase-like protein|nr:IS1595 family transposase [Bryobacteraceae bacterium]